MTNPETLVKQYAIEAVNALYNDNNTTELQVSKTRKEFVGDFTLVTFPLLKMSRKNPELTATEIGEWMVANCEKVEAYNVIKGFLNVVIKEEFWSNTLFQLIDSENFGIQPKNGRKVMVEYSSPNTNKPLHLGHIRNNLLGYAVAQILDAAGNEVMKVNLVNDRGIHICKSMLAWKMFGNGETPNSSGLKGDHLVGKYYVAFDKAYKLEIQELMAQGQLEDDAKKNAPLMLEAAEMLRKWEANDTETYDLWKEMNSWVYAGFEKTYKTMGVDFDKIYYESNTYLLGKKLVEDGLSKGVFYKRENGSVWVDLTDDGLDEKLLLRADGTSVYMTQDLGTALERFSEFDFDDMTYVVGNEQNYHFQVLKLIIKKLGYSWSDAIYHLSYGMVELPEGKMKSREGTVVDADDLMEGMIEDARTMSKELGKLDGLTDAEQDEICTTIGMGALKYFILKVDPKKTMLFNPAESIDFNGNTAPFIQYTHARICSLGRRANDQNIEVLKGIDTCKMKLSAKEIELVKLLLDFEGAVLEAAKEHAPSVMAAYCYELAKEYNQYYHDNPILKEGVAIEDKQLRLTISMQVAKMLKKAMGLLGINLPERM